jgi:hypothetical protein
MHLHPSPFRWGPRIIVLALAMALAGCGGDGDLPSSTTDSSGVEESTSTEEDPAAAEEPTGGDTAVVAPPGSSDTRRLEPHVLSYLGAFALPDQSGGSSWEYSGYAMTYYPGGDPAGADDGFPGSLFAVGHDHHQMVSEIAIPSPGPPGTPLEALPVAETLQPFADITSGMFGYLEIPRAGLAYVPDPGDADEGSLYFAWGQHFEDEQAPTHGLASLDLAAPNPAGPWHVGGYTNYVTNDYLFLIPESWTETYAPGMRLATGRFRDGHWSGLGPALLAVPPVDAAAPPAPGESIEAIPLLMYGEPVPGSPELAIDESRAMDGFGPADEWSGGVWLTVGDRAAVVLVGTKATGENWYGFADGTVYPISGHPDEVYPEVPPWPYDQRGWWSEGTSAQLLFFDPAELGAVALGEMDPWEPQPYAVVEVDEYLYDPGFDHERAKRYALGAAAFDPERGILYVIERRAGVDEKSVIHVFSVG